MPPKSGSGNSIFKKLQEKKEAEARAFAAARGTQPSSSSSPTPPPPTPVAPVVIGKSEATTIHEVEEAALQHVIKADITVTLRNDDSRDTSINSGSNNVKKGRSMSEIRRALSSMGDTTIAAAGGGGSGNPSSLSPNNNTTTTTTTSTNDDTIVGLSTRRDLFMPPQCPLGEEDSVGMLPLAHHILVPLEPSMQWRRWIGSGGNSSTAFKSQAEQLVSLCISDPVKLTSSSTTTTSNDKDEGSTQVVGEEGNSTASQPSIQGWGVSSFGRAWLRSLRLLESSYPLSVTNEGIASSATTWGSGRRPIATLSTTWSSSTTSTGGDHHYYLGTISNPLGGNSLAVAVVPTSALFTTTASTDGSGGTVKLAMTLRTNSNNNVKKIAGGANSKKSVQYHQDVCNGLVLPPDTTVPLLVPVRGSAPATSILAPLLNRGLVGRVQPTTTLQSSESVPPVSINVDLTRLGYTSGITSTNVGGGRYPSLRGLMPTTTKGNNVIISIKGGQMIDPLYAPPTGPNTDVQPPTTTNGTTSSLPTSNVTPLVASSWGNMPLDVKRLVLVEQLIPEMKIKTNNNSNKALSSSVVSPASSTHPLLLKERFRSTLQERIEAAAAAHHQSKQQPATYPAKIAADDNNSKPKDQGLLHTAQQLSSDLKDLVQQCVPIDVVGDHPREVVRDVATKLLLCTLQRDAFERYGIDIPKGVLLYDAASSSTTQKQHHQNKKDIFSMTPTKGVVSSFSSSLSSSSSTPPGAVGKTFLLGAMARTIAAVNEAVHYRDVNNNKIDDDLKLATKTAIKGTTLSISVDAHSLITKEVGGTEKNIALLMKLARRGQVAHFATQITSSPSNPAGNGNVDDGDVQPVVVATVVFIDNLEVIAPPRKGEGGGSGTTGDRALSTLLTELDGIRSTTAPPTTTTSKSNKNGGGQQQPIIMVPVIIVASSSGLSRLDPAVYRPGRLDLHIPLSQVTPTTAWKVLLSALAPLYTELFDESNTDDKTKYDESSSVGDDDDQRDWGLNESEMTMLRKLVPVMFPTTTTADKNDNAIVASLSSATPIFSNFGTPSSGVTTTNPFKTLPHLSVTDAKLIARQATYRFVGAATALKPPAANTTTATTNADNNEVSKSVTSSKKKSITTTQNVGIRRWLYGDSDEENNNTIGVVDGVKNDVGGIVGRVGLEACQLELSNQIQAAIKLVSPLTLFK